MPAARHDTAGNGLRLETGPRRGSGVVIAVDGPSGSGKSTVSRLVASRLGVAYLDTGAMYRAVCWACLAAGTDLADADAVAATARGLDLRMGTDPAAPGVGVAGTDVTDAIRESRISRAVSAVATNLAVREELRRRQRELIAELSAASTDGRRPGVVVEGRDITTVVAPDADVRVLLTADEAARLARRASELHGSSDAAAVERTRDEVVRRDADDSTVASFQVAADGVVTLDSSRLTLDETVDALLTIVTAAAA